MDDKKIKILAELGGMPEEVYDELVKDFTDQLSGYLIELQSAFAGADISRIGNLAHSIKGVAANLRIPSVEEPASMLETMAREKSPAGPMLLQADAIKSALAAILLAPHDD